MPKSKIILISRSKRAQNKLNPSKHQTEDEWATVEEIKELDNEEVSLPKIISLPSGKRPISSLDEVEAEMIRSTVESVKGNAAQAAKALQIGRATLYRKLDKYGLNLKEIRSKNNKLINLEQKRRETYKPLKIVKKAS